MIGRRHVLGGLGAAAVFPWVGGAHGQRPQPQPRLVLFYTPHGTVWDQWRPVGGRRDWEFSPILEPLRPYRRHVSIIDGLHMRSPYARRVPHTYDLQALWCGSEIDTEASDFARMDHGVTFGWNKGTSIDQAIAELLPRSEARFPTLEFGVHCGGAHPANRMIYEGPRRWRDPLDNPARAWSVLFDERPDPEPDRQALRRSRVLDTLVDDLRSLRPRLSAVDRARLEAHETALRELQATMTADPVTCEAPTRPTEAGLRTTIDQQIDLLVASLACGQTNIASLQITRGDNDGSLYEWAGIDRGGHHSVSHDTSDDAQDRLAALYTWYATRFARLLQGLAETPAEGGTTLLDNSLVIWGTEVGIGWNHSLANIPFVVAGGAGGRHHGGQYIEVDGAHNRLLVSAFHAMGLSRESYGSTDNGTGGVPGLIAP